MLFGGDDGSLALGRITGPFLGVEGDEVTFCRLVSIKLNFIIT